MKHVFAVRRDLIKKALTGFGALWLFGRSRAANADGGAGEIETQRRIALCREHISAEATEAQYANLQPGDPKNPHFSRTMHTLIDDPRYVLNGTPVNGRDTIVEHYTKLFAKLENVGFVENSKPYVAEQAIIFELTLKAHARGNPAKKVNLPLMVAFMFNERGGNIVGEHAYLDKAAFAQQLA